MSPKQAEGTQKCHIDGTTEGGTVTVQAVHGQVNF